MATSQNSVTQSVAPRPPADTITGDEIFQLFAWMKAQFGHLWVQEPDTDMEVWFQALGVFTTDDLRRGCKAVVKSGSDYPPSLPKFVGYCKGSVHDQRARADSGMKQLAMEKLPDREDREQLQQVRAQVTSGTPLVKLKWHHGMRDCFKDRIAEINETNGFGYAW